mmetsp:Transcript_13492/g.32020  ORF Transcript_13492/g.32020 Transcript_13492/m.32020 type:complete len:238 (+) Transcript_13492:489-1202(+)
MLLGSSIQPTLGRHITAESRRGVASATKPGLLVSFFIFDSQQSSVRNQSTAPFSTSGRQAICHWAAWHTQHQSLQPPQRPAPSARYPCSGLNLKMYFKATSGSLVPEPSADVCPLPEPSAASCVPFSQAGSLQTSSPAARARRASRWTPKRLSCWRISSSSAGLRFACPGGWCPVFSRAKGSTKGATSAGSAPPRPPKRVAKRRPCANSWLPKSAATVLEFQPAKSGQHCSLAEARG